MAQVLNTTFHLKRGLAARWVELNPVLDPGEPGFELDTFKLKVGNGETAWNDLPYVNEADMEKYITINDIINGTVISPIATETVRGTVLSSNEMNEIKVDPEDGSMEVIQLSIDRVHTDGINVILNGGDSSSLD